jgi:hypothetical protein
VRNSTEQLSDQPKINVKMVFKNLITFTTLLAFILSGFVCSAVIDSAHANLAILAEEGVSLESRQGPGIVVC